MEGLDGRILDGSVHSLGLPVCPRVIGLSKPVFDAMFCANTIEDVAAKHSFHFGIAASVLRKVGERHAVVRQHGVQGVREGIDHVAQERRSFHLASALVKLDDRKLGDAVDCQEHDEFAFGQAQFAAVDVDEADLGFCKPAAFGGIVTDRQTRNAVALQTSMQRASGELWDGVPQAAHDVIERQ